MANSGINYQRIIIDVTDPELTKCWVFIQALGDSPIGVHGWHFKAFGASVTSYHVMKKWADGEEDPLMWPQAAPEEMPREATTPAAMPQRQETQAEIDARLQAEADLNARQ